MSLTERIPGMVPGATRRNVVVGTLYFFLLPLIVVVGALFYLPYAVATNRHNLSERLAASPLGRIPTIKNGGIQSAVTVFIGALIIFALIGALAPADDSSEAGLESDSNGQPADVEGTDDAANSADTTESQSSGDTTGENQQESSETTDGATDSGESTDSGANTGDTTSDSGTDSTSETGSSTGTTTTDEASTGEASTDETTTDETSTGETNTDDTSSDDTSSDDTSSDDTTADDGTTDSDGDTSALTVEVVDIIDGDTMDIAYQNGSTARVRLLGVDTPEVHTDVSPDEFEGVPNNEAGRECLRGYGEQASTYAEEQLRGKTVTMQFDAAADRRGTFDRLLVYLNIDGESFNYELVASGHARVFDSTFSESERFYTAEAEAQETETGVWECRSVETEDEPESTAGGELAVARLHEDAAGDDWENLNDEYVIFENVGDEPLDLSGWRVEDESGAAYRFPTGFTLRPGDRVTLYTGSGSDTATNLYWGSGRPIWNNSGDTVFVYDDSGVVVVEYSYS